MTITINASKAFDKIQHKFMIKKKTTYQVGIKNATTTNERHI